MPSKRRPSAANTTSHGLKRAQGARAAAPAEPRVLDATAAAQTPALAGVPKQMIDLAFSEQRNYRAQIQQLHRQEQSVARLRAALASGRVPESLRMRPPTFIAELSSDAMTELNRAARQVADDASMVVARRLLDARVLELQAKAGSCDINAARASFIVKLQQLFSPAALQVALGPETEVTPRRAALYSLRDRLLCEVLITHEQRLKTESVRRDETAQRAAATMEASAELTTKDIIALEVQKAVRAALSRRPNGPAAVSASSSTPRASTPTRGRGRANTTTTTTPRRSRSTTPTRPPSKTQARRPQSAPRSRVPPPPPASPRSRPRGRSAERSGRGAAGRTAPRGRTTSFSPAARRA